ncbi:MAG: hypothetical protein LC101_10490, partial [Flavobacteriales bacterium]|nr:hypothetical protein [Flavobacteriales bacterium]
MRKIFILLSVCFTYNTQAQLAFQKYYGGPDNDEITGIIAETDHSFFLIGNTISYGQGGGFADVIHMRIDPAGNFVSSRTYGTSNRDLGRFLFKSTNGYLSGGVKLVGTGASDDLYIQKLDNAGNQTNLFFYGDNDPNGDEEIFAMQEIPSLNYYIMFGFDARNAAILQEACFKMVKSDGTHVASRYYGGPGWADCAFDGFFNLSGIYLGGRTNSIGAGGFDGLAIRTANTSPYGIIWQRAIGGVNDDEFLSMKETPSGELICAGYTKSLGATGEDIFVVKLNLLSGDTIWSRRIGGAGNERARYVLPTADGGFILAGHTTSAGAGGEDAFLMKLASNGTTQWAKLYGGPANDGFTTLAIRPSSFGYAAAGYSYSFTNGGSDMYFVATDMSGVSACNEQNWNPANVIVRPTVKTTGLTANSNTHTSQTETFANTNPTLATNCKCIEERPRVDITGPLQVCRNQTGVIYSIPAITGVVTYNWTATNATIISPLNSTSATINFGTGNAQIIVQAIYGNCSTFNIDTINVTIDPITANITGTTTICNGQSTILTGSAVGPISGVSGYAWNTGATTSFINVSPSTNTTYTVTITDGLGCTATKSTTVIVNPLPIPTVGSNS